MANTQNSKKKDGVYRQTKASSRDLPIERKNEPWLSFKQLQLMKINPRKLINETK